MPKGAGVFVWSTRLHEGNERLHVEGFGRPAGKTFVHQRLYFGNRLFPRLITPDQVTNLVTDIGISAAAALLLRKRFERVGEGDVHCGHAGG